MGPPLDVVKEIIDRVDCACDLVSYGACCTELYAASALRRHALAFAKHKLRVCIRAIRAAIAHRRAFVQWDTGRWALMQRAESMESIVMRLERAPHGLLDLFAATQKALSSVESQSLVEPSRVQRLKQDLSSLGSLACLLAWRAVARERRRQAAAAAAAAAAALQPAWLPAAASAASGTAAAATTAAGDGAASAAAAGGAAAAAMAAGAAAVGAAVVGGAAAGAALGGAVAGRQDADGLRGTGPTALVSTAVQTEHSLSLEGVRELVTSFRALADSSNPSTRLCLDTLNLVDFYLSREAWNYQEDGGQGDHDDDADQAFVGGQQQGAGGDVGHGEVAGVEGEAGVEEEGVEEEEV